MRFWWWADAAYKLLGVTLFVGATAELSFLGGYLTPLGALYWWSGLLIAIVLLCGLWASAEKYVPLKRCLGAGETATDREALLRVRNPKAANRGDPADNAHRQLLMTTLGTTYFSSMNANKVNNGKYKQLPGGGYNYLNSSSNAASSTVVHVTAGPKLVNIKPLLLGSRNLSKSSASRVKKKSTAAAGAATSTSSGPKGGSTTRPHPGSLIIKGQREQTKIIAKVGGGSSGSKKSLQPSHPLSKSSSSNLRKGKSIGPSSGSGQKGVMRKQKQEKQVANLSSLVKFKKGFSAGGREQTLAGKNFVPSPQKSSHSKAKKVKGQSSKV